MSIYIYVGTGRINCKKCGTLIAENEMGLMINSYNISEKYCLKCIKGLINEIETGSPLKVCEMQKEKEEINKMVSK